MQTSPLWVRPQRLDEEARIRRQGTHLSVRVGLIAADDRAGSFYRDSSTTVLCQEERVWIFYIGKDVHCGMKSEHLVGTSIPRFTYDTPTVPENDFYGLCEGGRPLCMIFLPGFDHPVSREYITRYLKTLPSLKGARLACVVRSSAQAVAAATRGSDFPFPVICDGPGVLYGYLGVEQTRGLLSWSFAAQKIYKAAKDAGYHYDKAAPQILPLTLVVGHKGKILFTHSGRSQTDLPEDCAAIAEIVKAVEAATVQAHADANPHCSDETLTLPDLMGWDD